MCNKTVLNGSRFNHYVIKLRAREKDSGDIFDILKSFLHVPGSGFDKIPN